MSTITFKDLTCVTCGKQATRLCPGQRTEGEGFEQSVTFCMATLCDRCDHAKTECCKAPEKTTEPIRWDFKVTNTATPALTKAAADLYRLALAVLLKEAHDAPVESWLFVAATLDSKMAAAEASVGAVASIRAMSLIDEAPPNEMFDRLFVDPAIALDDQRLAMFRGHLKPGGLVLGCIERDPAVEEKLKAFTVERKINPVVHHSYALSDVPFENGQPIVATPTDDPFHAPIRPAKEGEVPIGHVIPMPPGKESVVMMEDVGNQILRDWTVMAGIDPSLAPTMHYDLADAIASDDRIKAATDTRVAGFLSRSEERRNLILRYGAEGVERASAALELQVTRVLTDADTAPHLPRGMTMDEAKVLCGSGK